MSKNMLIDSAHMEEIRVAVVNGEKLDKFDFEIPSKAQVKGNIYLAKVIRVEPSLQAAFVDYGGERHGFLSFSEIHCDYFQIPVDDRRDLENHIQSAVSALLAETSAEELDPKEVAKLRYQFYRRYKIQEVIKKRQVILVQVEKEERGNKGAALTTYISLAGRYCVLMPNTARGSGISRKIADHSDRAKLRKIVSDLHAENGMENGSTVVRTAGAEHSKMEIAKDFGFLKKMWDEIRETTVKSTAPCLIHEEANIIKRAIRDLYSRDVESIFVEGEEGYKIAKSFAKKLMPGQAKKVKLYEDKKLPLFAKFKINDQINQIYSTRVDLPSGGYLIINTTEALISIDVNSGKATRERNISEMALKTNLEAAAEIARQCRLRDLAGLIVVDFIDMGEKRDNSQVEKCLRDTLREDRAKIQVGTISSFGLLEFSRQRLRSSIADANMSVCSHCNGIGFVWSNESIAIQVLRKIEETFAVLNFPEVVVTLSTNVALYLMNNKRSFISELEKRTNSKVLFKIDNSIAVSDFKIEQTMHPVAQDAPSSATKRHVHSSSKEENDIVENNSASDEVLENKEEDRSDDRHESSKEVASFPSMDRDRKNRSMRRNRHFHRKKQYDNAEPAGNSTAVETETNVSASENRSLPSETESVVKFIEGHNKVQEAVFNLQSSEKKEIVGPNKKEKTGWWQKLLQKKEKEILND
ncbi:MAG: ribonuclease E/G [Holosporaceae bacterium]|jgi:ribonuclease E|nr:ribonuclease E/G [Holosporaceae bacterium]